MVKLFLEEPVEMFYYYLFKKYHFFAEQNLEPTTRGVECKERMNENILSDFQDLQFLYQTRVDFNRFLA